VLRQNDREELLLEQEYASDAGDGKASRYRVPFSIQIDTRQLKIDDGPASIRISAWDKSWRQRFDGNRTDIEADFVIDTKPPDIEVLSTSHNIYQGGSGLVIYRLSEVCDISGVYVGDDFFPGRSGYYPDDDLYLAFIALASRHGRDTQMHAHAVDRAGNTSRRGFYYRILSRSFKTDTININDTFLNMKLPEFYAMDGWPADATLVEQFLFVNETLREKNNATILGLSPESESQMFWQGAFGRLPNSAQQAGFADHRLYRYNGEIIDEATHLGIDLASVRQAPVPAANAGRVVTAHDIGIYGNTVIIDHGFGLFSLYSHLSKIMVAPGDMVSKEAIIGHTGTSGWAGGDHLHFSMIVNHVFVNPVEWWDPTWIKHNITDKLDGLTSQQE
jgi:murein DD-endopeptidase MepM/ murein hydrolase activator NlpD